MLERPTWLKCYCYVAWKLIDRLMYVLFYRISRDRYVQLCSRCASQFGWTALHLAAHEGRVQAMEVLLAFGATKNIRNQVL